MNNIRASITDDNLEGEILFDLLQGKKREETLASIKKLMSDYCPNDNRLHLMYATASGFGGRRRETPLIWREARFEAAKHNYGIYRADNDMLNRVIAIDETSIIPGKLEVILAAVKFRFIASMFLTKGTTKATGEIITKFLKDHVAPEVGRRGINEPFILWDNALAHKTKSTRDFLANNGWTELMHPARSNDMNPLDYSDISQLKQRYTATEDPETAEKSVQRAIREINSEGILQGIIRLPAIWESLIATEGLATRDPGEFAAKAT